MVSWRQPFGFERREIDGETIAYCDVTGDTFKLAPVACAILDRLSTAPADIQALSEHLSAAFGVSNAPDMAEAVEKTVSDLEILGIIERDPL